MKHASMSTRLAAVLGAGAEAFGHGSDASGAPQPRATRDAARARWGKDWWKVAKDARLAQLGREGYKVEQPSRPKPRGAKPDRPKWDDDYSSDEEAAPAPARVRSAVWEARVRFFLKNTQPNAQPCTVPPSRWAGAHRRAPNAPPSQTRRL